MMLKRLEKIGLDGLRTEINPNSDTNYIRSANGVVHDSLVELRRKGNFDGDNGYFGLYHLPQ